MKNYVEDTLVIIKNESIKRHLVGKIIQKFEDVGLEISHLGMFNPNKTIARKHYSADNDWIKRVGEKALISFKNKQTAKKVLGTTNIQKIGLKIYQWSVDQLTKVPVIVMVLKGTNAIEKVKQIAGNNEPAKADLSTIRGIFSTDSYVQSNYEKRALFNVIHRSSNKKEAKREIKVWFP